MKKFLVILMVVAMASVLFVGCTTPPTPTPTPDPDPTPAPTPTIETDTPFITAIATTTGTAYVFGSTATQYINDLDVDVVAAVGSVIKLYVNDVWVGTGAVGIIGTAAAIQATGVIADGVKTIHVTATAPGLTESLPSTVYTATYDTTAPTLASAAADSTDQTVTVTFSEGVKQTAASLTGAGTLSALDVTNWQIGGVPLTVVQGDSAAAVSSTVVRLNVFNSTAAVVPTAGAAFNVTAVGQVEDLAGNLFSATDQTIYGIVGD